ncbi:MAG: tRNA (guanosine(37)-N1)-methyltransferase TrmD [Chloroflexota bacterium]
MLHFDIITLFPSMFDAYLGESILKRAKEAGLVTFNPLSLRSFSKEKHHVTDEPPYGGGGGMILKPKPIFEAVAYAQAAQSEQRGKVVLLTPQGDVFDQNMAKSLSLEKHLIFICGRYEGVDERVRSELVDQEISIGDFVLTGGEVAAMVIIDAVTRLLPGALGADGASETDSHATGLLEGPHYTRPVTFEGIEVPPVLRSGHAANIARWRREQALRRTWTRRPEMLLKAELSEEDKRFLATLAREQIRQMMGDG